MKLIIEIDLDHGAFELAPGLEIGRILKKQADALDEWTPMIGDRWTLLDFNGNKVGYARIEK